MYIIYDHMHPVATYKFLLFVLASEHRQNSSIAVPGNEEGPDGIVQDTVGALTLAQSCSADAILHEGQPNGQGQ